MTAPHEIGADVHVANALKALDPDRYYASLVLPTEKRTAIQSLLTMSAEVAAVRERVSEPAPGEIRIQWWVDAIAGEGHGNVRQNPLAASVLEAIDTYSLPTGPLLRLFAARRFDLYQDPMPDVGTFEGYAGETHSVLFQYASIILNDGDAVEHGDAAGHLGVAQAYLGHLSAFGFNASRSQIFLPMDIFAAHGVSDAEIFMGKPTPQIIAAHAQIVELAQEHLNKAKYEISKLPKKLRPAFAYISLLNARVQAHRQNQKTPFAPIKNKADWRKLATLSWWMIRNA